MVSYIIILIILILVNAFFAAAEIAFISLNDSKIDLQVRKGNKKAKKIKKMLEDPSKFLATIQIGVTLAGFLSSAFASDSFADVLALALNRWIPSIEFLTWRNISIIIITIILSYFTLVFGELLPKRIAMKYYEKISYSSIGIIKFMSIITAPFVKLLTLSTNLFSKIFGINSKEEEIVTEEEIRMMVDVGEEKGVIEEEEKEMINNVFELNDKVVSEIMIPRNKMFAVDKNCTVNEFIAKISKEKKRYSRVPIYDNIIDKIIGIVYVKDILFIENTNIKIETLLKDAYFVLESKPVNQVFNELQKNKLQIAILLDEYGGTAGMITMEDILEEIVGEIYDEYDKETEKIKKISNDIYIFDGSIALYEVEKILKIELPEGDYDTLAGYLIEKLGRIPKENEEVTIENEKAIFKIEKIEDKKIMKVKITKKEK